MGSEEDRKPDARRAVLPQQEVSSYPKPLEPQSSVAARLLRVGQSVMFVALLAVGTVTAGLSGAGSLVLAGAAGLVVLFGAGLAVHGRVGSAGRLVWVVTLLVGTLVLVAASRSFLWVLFPVWMLLAQVAPLWLALPLTALSLATLMVVLGYREETAPGAFLGPLIGAAVAVGLSRGAQRLEEEGRQYRQLLARVLRDQEEMVTLHDEVVRAQRETGALAERTRLSRDIHDTLAQGFSSILLLARAANRDPDPKRLGAILDQIESTAASNLAESRRVVHALAPSDLDYGGLAVPLRRLAADLGTQTGAEVHVDIDPDLPRLSTATEVALLRAAQSAMANVRRHSGASRVVVTLGAAGGLVHLDVVDDGAGFEPTALTHMVPTLQGGYGLVAMRARLGELGGGLDVESAPGEGTALSAHVPLVSADPVA